MNKRASAGDSQVLVAVKPKRSPGSDRLKVEADRAAESATLTANCQVLYPEDGPNFEAACRRLVETRQPQLFISFLKVKRLPSVIIGLLAKASGDAEKGGQKIVVLAKEANAKIIRMILRDQVEVRAS